MVGTWALASSTEVPLIRSFRPTGLPHFKAAEAGYQHIQGVELGAHLIQSLWEERVFCLKHIKIAPFVLKLWQCIEAYLLVMFPILKICIFHKTLKIQIQKKEESPKSQMFHQLM